MGDDKEREQDRLAASGDEDAEMASLRSKVRSWKWLEVREILISSRAQCKNTLLQAAGLPESEYFLIWLEELRDSCRAVLERIQCFDISEKVDAMPPTEKEMIEWLMLLARNNDVFREFLRRDRGFNMVLEPEFDEGQGKYIRHMEAIIRSGGASQVEISEIRSNRLRLGMGEEGLADERLWIKDWLITFKNYPYYPSEEPEILP